MRLRNLNAKKYDEIHRLSLHAIRHFFDALPILQFLYLQLALNQHKKYHHNYIDNEPVLKPLGVKKLPTISKRYGAEVRIVAFGKSLLILLSYI